MPLEGSSCVAKDGHTNSLALASKVLRYRQEPPHCPWPGLFQTIVPINTSCVPACVCVRKFAFFFFAAVWDAI